MLRGDLYNAWAANESDWGFEIISGEYKDAVIQLKEITFADEQTGELTIDYHVISKPEGMEDIEQQDQFKAVMEIIINDILKEAIDNFQHEQIRNDNTEEPGSQ